MSSRALRKLQKEQELEKQLVAVREAEAAQADQDEESEEEEPQSIVKKPMNAYNMLDGIDTDEDEDMDEDHDDEAERRTENVRAEPPPSQPSKPKKKKKKGKKKGKGKAEDTPNGAADLEPGMDEIDRALKELSTSNPEGFTDTNTPLAAEKEMWAKETTKLLAIDSKNLNPVNEMKSLFGNIALEGTTPAPARPQRRREQEQAQQGGMDLGTALSGRQCAGTKGKELGPLAHRRNLLMQGKEEWPGASSGGLSMDLEKDASSFERKYNIVHDKYYQETQSEFMHCVQSMEPQALITLLRLVPYHIATLLQVSEIAKVQGDHSVSGDLLERALFNFGRSMHSSFGSAVKEGTARLSFSKSANREMYLSIWRYIRNLEQRGTWKTAFEWAKLLLQLDPARDPYGVTLMIDQLALRGRQHAAFIEMCAEDAYGEMWNHLPNIQISLALAYQRNKKPAQARQTLAVAMHKYPYILSELAKSLDIEPLPRKLWGKLPSTDAETLYTQLYVTRAKDLWNTPELTSLLVEVAETLNLYKQFIDAARPAPKLEISLEEARHIMLLEIPALIGLLPRKFTNMRTSMSDPLPPPDSGVSNEFTARAPASADGSATDYVGNIFGAASGAAGSLLDRVLNWFSAPAGNGDDDQQAAVQELADRLEIQPQEAQAMLADYMARRDEMQAVPGLDDGLRGGDRMVTMEEFMDGMEHSDGDDSDSLPELESIPDTAPAPSANPMAATVEEEEDEDAQPSQSASTSALLRHVDSDDDVPSMASINPGFTRDSPAFTPDPRFQDRMAHPNPTHTVFASTSRNPTQAPVIEPTDDIETTRDPQRIQRWLLSAGFESIKDGQDMAKYVDRLKVLPKQQRDWTIRMVEQRGGKTLAGQVRAATGD